MKTVRSRLRILLAEKENRERRTISLRELHRETGVPMSTVMGLANNSLRAVPLDGLLALCEYLGCEVGDLLRIEDTDRRAPWFARPSRDTNQGARAEGAGVVGATPVLRP
jgi:putative transcriptional regulator